MDIHTALKEVITNYGVELVRSSVLVNYLADKKCFNEFRSAKSILKEIITSYGENIYMLKLNNHPYEPELLKYKSDFSKTKGYQKEIVNYLFECISYGLLWENNVDFTLKKLRETHLGVEKAGNSNNRLLFYANLYNYFGINVTCIQGKPEDKETYLYEDPWSSTEIRHPFKEPSDPDWKFFLMKNKQSSISRIRIGKKHRE